MKALHAIFLSMLMLISSVYAGAEFGITGHDILELCESDKVEDKAVCAYYIAGISGGIAQAVINTGEDPPHCLPVSIRMYQLVSLYNGYAEKNPQFMYESSDSVVAAMLRSNFPCRTD